MPKFTFQWNSVPKLILGAEVHRMVPKLFRAEVTRAEHRLPRPYLVNFTIIIQFDDTSIFSWTSTLFRCYTLTIPSTLIFPAHCCSTFITLPALGAFIANTMASFFIATLIVATFPAWFRTLNHK